MTGPFTVERTAVTVKRPYRLAGRLNNSSDLFCQIGRVPDCFSSRRSLEILVYLSRIRSSNLIERVRPCVISFARSFFSSLQFSLAPPLIRTMRLLAAAGAMAVATAEVDLRQ